MTLREVGPCLHPFIEPVPNHLTQLAGWGVCTRVCVCVSACVIASILITGGEIITGSVIHKSSLSKAPIPLPCLQAATPVPNPLGCPSRANQMKARVRPAWTHILAVMEDEYSKLQQLWATEEPPFWARTHGSIPMIDQGTKHSHFHDLLSPLPSPETPSDLPLPHESVLVAL